MDFEEEQNGDKNISNRPPSINHFHHSIRSRKSDESNLSYIGSTDYNPYPQKMSLESNISEKAKKLMVQQDLFQNLAAEPYSHDFRNRGSYNYQFKTSQEYERISDMKEQVHARKIQAPQKISIQNYIHQEKSINQQILEIYCKCSKSKCLLMYCQCFSKGIVCNQKCSCYQCRNNHDFQDKRTKARNSVLERDPHAFSNKFQLVGDNKNINLAYRRGCNCKKTLCFKKYCQCFYAGVKCTYLCNCQNCMNGGENAYKEDKGQ